MATARSISQMRYDRQSSRHYGMKLNVKTDADIIAMLDKQPSFQTYIKRLIRNDIKAEEEETMMKDAARIHDMLKVLDNEPNFDTFDASPNFHYFPDLCSELGVTQEDFSSYGDLFNALINAAETCGVDVSDIEGC